MTKNQDPVLVPQQTKIKIILNVMILKVTTLQYNDKSCGISYLHFNTLI